MEPSKLESQLKIVSSIFHSLVESHTQSQQFLYNHQMRAECYRFSSHDVSDSECVAFLHPKVFNKEYKRWPYRESVLYVFGWSEPDPQHPCTRRTWKWNFCTNMKSCNRLFVSIYKVSWQRFRSLSDLIFRVSQFWWPYRHIFCFFHSFGNINTLCKSLLLLVICQKRYVCSGFPPPWPLPQFSCRNLTKSKFLLPWSFVV